MVTSGVTAATRDTVAREIAEKTGAKVVVLYPSVGGKPGLDDYFKTFDYDLNELVKALK